MVSHLVVLATGDNIVEELLRQENNSNETVLHMAVRNGDHQFVKLLLAKDPKLACFPEKGTSPLYLAILQKKGSIARILYDESENNVLFYSGPNGQNALHAAVLRGPGTHKKPALFFLLLYIHRSYMYQFSTWIIIFSIHIFYSLRPRLMVIYMSIMVI